MINKIKLIYHTVKYLRIIQVFYQLKYLVRSKTNSGFRSSFFKAQQYQAIGFVVKFNQQIAFTEVSKKGLEFQFLNYKHDFDRSIDWNYAVYGKLWTYNLNYFNFLLQRDVSREEGIGVIEDFIGDTALLKDGLEPYPISLRGVNWIKFLSKHEICDQNINDHLFTQYQLLTQQLEFHLLGNHLLENGLSLLFGGVYFKNTKLYNKGKSITQGQLKEQILQDGGHFELSPMYHQILLEKLLDCIQLLQQNGCLDGDENFLNYLELQASLMFSWLEQITFSDGSIPLFNDASNGIAPSTKQLLKYGSLLNIQEKKRGLSKSGYRSFNTPKYEVKVDVGAVGPSYQPGHAHADTFSFVLYAAGRPLIIDPGISTYEKNNQRQEERGTAFHNTLMFEETNSSIVWGGFRVAERAQVRLIEDDETKVLATHDGYHKIGGEHQRGFYATRKEFSIIDQVTQVNGENKWQGTLHFHPSVQLSIQEQTIIGEGFTIYFEDISELRVEDYNCPDGYNKYTVGKKIIYQPDQKSTIKIAFA